MKRPFKQEHVSGLGPIGYLIPEANPEVEWFFNTKTTATREYKGTLMRKSKRGWQFHTVIDGTWNDVYVKNSYFRQALQVLQDKWSERQSNFSHVQEFEDAESPFTEEYELGEYWLIRPDNPEDNWYLVPVDKAEQLSNVNAIDIHEIKDVPVALEALQKTLAPMRDSVHGVIFTTEDGRRTGVRLNDFDWSEYDAES